jgi:hypothetical protein
MIIDDDMQKFLEIYDLKNSIKIKDIDYRENKSIKF